MCAFSLIIPTQQPTPTVIGQTAVKLTRLYSLRELLVGLKTMRLLDTQSIQLIDFITPPKSYAILSHTWGDEEVSFQEIHNPSARRKKGYNKIASFCFLAQQDGYQYAWVDTCCIDKTSSSELSEAINSMYSWYAKSSRCYAYLEDITTWNQQPNLYEQRNPEWRHSRWFTRGWTLQELLAPTVVVFYNYYWQPLGSRSYDIVYGIASATGIDRAILQGQRRVSLASVAERMSWASRRQTTRREDMAYCLMGLFDVNMPLLYGEGGKAFIRLQEAILAQTDDQTILAWPGDNKGGSGALAPDVSHFAECGGLVPSFQTISEESVPWSMTNLGLRLRVPIYHPSIYEHLYEPETCLAILNCTNGTYSNDIIAIRLKHVSSHQVDQYTRLAQIQTSIDFGLAVNATTRTIYIRENFEESFNLMRRREGFYIRKLPPGYHIAEVYPKKYWDEVKMMIRSPCERAALRLADDSGDKCVVVIGYNNCRILRMIELPGTSEPLEEARDLVRLFKYITSSRVGPGVPAPDRFYPFLASCGIDPYFAEPGSFLGVIDYKLLLSQVRSEWTSQACPEHSIDFDTEVKIKASVSSKEILGRLVELVDIEVNHLGFTQSTPANQKHVLTHKYGSENSPRNLTNVYELP